MSTLVNLVISFFVGILLGQQIEEPRTAHMEFQKDSTEIYKKLEARQIFLDC
ncbi:MAG TPA: hypothetical protein VJ973_08355 [Christiangramia sp.]|nr:hypothetical protein [Christiangramia sp.]